MENYINDIIKEIENKKLACILRIGDKDIDIFSNNYKELKSFLLENGFINIFENKYKSKFSIFSNKKLIVFDLVKNFGYISDLFFNNFSTKEIIGDNYLSDKNEKLKFDTLRYILFFRKDKFSFFKENYFFINKNGFYFDFLDKKIFRKNFSNFEDLRKFLEKDIFILFKYLKLKYFLLHYLFLLFRFVKIVFKRLFTNNTFAIVGYDGSGKTTITNILSKEFETKTIYMGSKQFFDRFYYSKLESNLLLKLFRLFLVYIDFLILYLKISFYTIKKQFIFYDRHPKMDIMPNSGIANFALKFIFLFYPSPKKYFILYNEPNIILERKKEMKFEEIEYLNKNILNNLSKNKRVLIIKNDNIDDTLNFILKELYK